MPCAAASRRRAPPRDGRPVSDTLRDELRRLIEIEGPMPVDRYMALCLGHPLHGYYMTRDPLGARGDFTTSPEISQMFGELLGLWAAEVWRMMGAPARLVLAELGPGRGTLMADVLRAAKAVPAFARAIELHLVETSPVLTARQRQALANRDVTWHRSMASVPDGPAIVLANELFDALPVRQFVRAGGGWRERLVGLDEGGGLRFGLASEAEPAARFPAEAEGAVREMSPAGLELAQTLASRLAAQGGACLVIDYGHDGDRPGDTLQAVKDHAFADPLAEPGEADLTAHVDFHALARVALGAGAAVHGPAPQGVFLRALGIDARADALARAAPDAAAAVKAAALRLTDAGSPRAMGALFKAMALADPALPALPAFGRLRIPSRQGVSP